MRVGLMVPIESLYLPPPRGSQLETKGMALELPLAQEGFQTWEEGKVAFRRTSQLLGNWSILMCFKSNQYPRFSLCPNKLEGSVKQGLCNCPQGSWVARGTDLRP